MGIFTLALMFLIRFVLLPALALYILSIFHNFVFAQHTFTNNEYFYIFGLGILSVCIGKFLKIRSYNNSYAYLIFCIALIVGFIKFNWYIPIYAVSVLGLITEVVTFLLKNFLLKNSGYEKLNWIDMFAFISSIIIIVSLIL
jgi:hypothetical protein